MTPPDTDLTADEAPRVSRREEKAAQVRESIMASALEAFSEDTFAGARIQNVAARADVALGTIYNYFENKEALANEVYRRWKAETRRYAVDPAPSGSSRETFARWWSSLVAFYTDHPQAFIFLETQHHSPFLDDESRQLAASVDKTALDAFRAWQKSGDIRVADPELLNAMVVGVFTAIVTETERLGRRLDPAALELGEESAWAMLQAPS